MRRIEQARPAVVYGLLALALAGVFVPMSLGRLVDGDEGTYLMVSRLVAEGRVPYHDFYFPQLFLLPYVYGLWLKMFGFSWTLARLLSAALSVALGLLVFRQAARLAGTRAWGVLAALLFAFTSLAFGWYPLVKTFVLPTLLLFGACAVVSTSSRWRWLAGGLLLGLATDCRVYLLGCAPAFLLELTLTEPDRRKRLAEGARFGLGLVLALLPNEIFFLIGPRTFLFDVVGSQLLRSGSGFVAGLPQKAEAVARLLGINSAEGVTSVQFLVLFLLNLASWVSDARSAERPPLVSTIALSLLLASLVPTPIYTQYFCIPVPFLVVNACVFVAKLAREVVGPRLRHVFTSLVVVYVLVSPLDIYRYTLGGTMVSGIEISSNAVDWKLSTIRAVARAIDREVRPDRPLVMSFWPGYLLETQAAILPGMENHFALMFSGRVSQSDAIAFKLMSYPELAWHFQHRTVDVVVLGNWAHGENHQWLLGQLAEHGYVLRERVVSTEIYTLPRDLPR